MVYNTVTNKNRACHFPSFQWTRIENLETDPQVNSSLIKEQKYDVEQRNILQQVVEKNWLVTCQQNGGGGRGRGGRTLTSFQLHA